MSEQVQGRKVLHWLAGTPFMNDVLGVTLPFFALLGLGFWAARVRLVPLESVAGLNAFVLYLALPCMLFRFAAQTPLRQLLDPWVVLVWLGSAAVMVALLMLWARRSGQSWRDGAFVALVSTFPNSGFMGVPLLLGLLGASVAGPTMATVVLDMVVTSSVCLALAHVGQAGGGWMAVKHALWGAAKNPMPWAVLSGALASVWQWTPPAPLATSMGLLADAATPVALFSIGVVLFRTQQAQAARHGQADALQAPAEPVLLPVCFKLLLHPALVALGLWAAAGMGWEVPKATCLALILVAALPSAGNVALLAERFGVTGGAVARITLWSTLWALLSFNAVVSLLWSKS